jgi:hypothetical protein
MEVCSGRVWVPPSTNLGTTVVKMLSSNFLKSVITNDKFSQLQTIFKNE